MLNIACFHSKRQNNAKQGNTEFPVSIPYLCGGWCNSTNGFLGQNIHISGNMLWNIADFNCATQIILSLGSTLPLVVGCKASLVYIQTQENIAFLTFPSRQTLWIEVASPLLVTVKCPLSQVLIMHIWWWFVLLGSWGMAFILRWWRARWSSANFACWLVDLVESVGSCQAKPFERHWFLVQ